jgi:hypothetical protein
MLAWCRGGLHRGDGQRWRLRITGRQTGQKPVPCRRGTGSLRVVWHDLLDEEIEGTHCLVVLQATPLE